ncbi:MAG TPA: choice-of-anchor tandem repeat GloVer-containing protein, partial [Candidatus Paceibacterota bacterium]|nr:choice-of-anchor tandem repeat GloVer-containing protein [Candidatus Paceibacterota bacterium]
MKNCIKNRFLLPALIAAISLFPTHPATAQTFTTLHAFTNSPDGATPYAGLVLSGNTLYGTAPYGGNAGNGTIFAVNTDGTGYTNLYRFTDSDYCFNPMAGLVLSGSTLYGTGFGVGGAVFAINTDGSGFAVLHTFIYSDGVYPYGGLVLSGTTL